MQLGYTKYCCFLCDWDSRDKKNHCVNKLWPKHTSLTPEEKNVFNPPLILPEKIYLPPLHIKLGLMKNFVKGMGKAGRRFEYVRNNFPNVGDANMKEGVFTGPQIRELMQDNLFLWRPEWDCKKCMVVIYEDLQGLLRKSQSCVLSWCYVEPVDFVQSYGMQYESENPLPGITLGFFFQKISAKSVTNMVKNFTKTLWLWKSSTKASGPQICWQTIAGHWRGMYLTPNTGQSHKPVHFRRKFTPVSWERNVLFCTFKFLCTFETQPDREILYKYLNSV